MNERYTGWLALVLLGLLAALTFWLERVAQPPTAAQSRTLRHDPDYIVDGLFATRMDQEGRVKHTLHAAKMTHFPDDDVTLLAEPRLVTYGEDRAPVTVTAREARMSGDGENVYFERDVRVVRARHGNQGELVLDTQYLHVMPEDNIAKTDRPVIIHNASTVINASGLELNSETRILELQGRVSGKFVPSHDAQQNAP
ncbi:MAG: LPS export ABC transporter periplasmic protein LptC [Pseudomonadota bacterium]